MKLELVMLATVFSIITERQVEAQVDCYENRNFTGIKATITKSIRDTTSLFPNGLRACEVSVNSTLIFYSGPDYRGNFITFNGGNKRVYPRSSFTTASILMLGDPTVEEGIFLFQEVNFQGGSYHFFNGEVEKVQGTITFNSVVVIGEKLDWTIVRKCRKSNCERKCFDCLRRAESRASFIRSINSTGMWETKAIIPGACFGTNYTGESNIPECPCNQHGVVAGPDQCQGKKGICQCKSPHTGDDCDSCQSSHIYRDGKCIAKQFTCYVCNDNMKGQECNGANPKTEKNCKSCWGGQNSGANKPHQSGCNRYDAMIACFNYGTSSHCNCKGDLCNGNLNGYLTDPNFPSYR